ncbi:hypothetical protein [Shewanella salipaludis]|uniref:Uncharacterized protein n=1 Tax=Shewanella salipaludis TaxID=2723052 RepID=A0A972JMF0_9GAMM|nr:hypothetical protein [Shewanella salipaludis]NMH67194.1 hypothetical protein [Shewanella salipaludis]
MKLIEIVKGFPRQENVASFKQCIKGLTDEELLRLTIPLLDEIEGRARICLIKVLSTALKYESSFMVILDIGCRKKLVSEIGEWLKFLVPRIKLKEFVKLVNGYKEHDVEIVSIILYKLQFILDEEQLKKFE